MGYEITKASNGQFRFALKAGNGEVILHSETYVQKASAQNGIQSVQKNSQEDGRYERKTASDGRAYFTLKAANGEVIGTSEMYSSESARDAGILAVKTSGASTEVEDKS
ncbi:MAG: YegP family protein [Dehalococcoidia bacterium]|nr:YegP family protein [Dehalococcoidia bacterium]